MREVVDAKVLEGIKNTLTHSERDDYGRCVIDKYYLHDILREYHPFAIVEQESRVHAKWVKDKNGEKTCSYCGEGCSWVSDKYCSSCGAKMDMGEEAEELWWDWEEK